MAAPRTQCDSMVFDHIDLRVADVNAVRPFYDTFLKAFGFRHRGRADLRGCKEISAVELSDYLTQLSSLQQS